MKTVAAGEGGFDGRRFVRDIGRTPTNRNYVVLLFGLAFASLMSGVRMGLGIYVNSYYWRLTNDQIGMFVFASFAGYLFAALVLRRLHARLDKRGRGRSRWRSIASGRCCRCCSAMRAC